MTGLRLAPSHLSVVVPTRDRPAMLDVCLQSLRAALADSDELLVVDSASKDPEVANVALRHGAIYVRCDEPGASRARNEGWTRAAFPLVAFVDDDVRVSVGWASALRGVVADHPEVAFVTGKVDLPPGLGATERPVAVKLDLEPAQLDGSTVGVFGHSANLAVRRDVLQAVDGFDELLGAGGRFRAAEDNDLFDRLVAAGFTGRYEPAVDGYHEQWRGRSEKVRLAWSYGVGMGARLRKLAVTDRARARRVAVDWLWTHGASRLAQAVRHRYEFEIAVILARVAGTAVGLVTSAAVPVRDGHLRSRSAAGPRS